MKIEGKDTEVEPTAAPIKRLELRRSTLLSLRSKTGMRTGVSSNSNSNGQSFQPPAGTKTVSEP